MTYRRDRYVRISSEIARKKGIDWTARGIYIADRKETIKLLEDTLAELKGERNGG